MTNLNTDNSTVLRMLDEHQRDTARYLAGLLDGEVERRTPVDKRDWVAHHLGMQPGELTELHRGVTGFEQLIQLTALGQLLVDHPPVALGGPVLPSPPVFAPALRADLAHLPEELIAAWPHLDLLGCPVGLMVEPGFNGESYSLDWYVPTRALHTFQVRLPGALRQLEASAAAALRGGTYRLSVDWRPELEPLDLPPIRREELILPEALWRLLDDDLHRLFRHAEVLLELGLGIDRGVLLHGQPGTGKTDLLRVVMQELAGQATVLLPDAEVAKKHLRDLYRLAMRLRPSLVVLDDIDLIVGQDRSRESLVEFLHAVDGAASTHQGVITLASTNHLNALDDAAKRPARFDRVIEVPLPPLAGRERILSRYLGHFAPAIDVRRVAHAAEGASGAHLREVVRQAILASDGEPTTDALLDAVQELGLGPASGLGVYL